MELFVVIDIFMMTDFDVSAKVTNCNLAIIGLMDL